MWQWLAALAALGGAGAAQMMADVSSPKNDYNLSYDRSERLRVFARSDADFADAKIYVSAAAPRPLVRASAHRLLRSALQRLPIPG